MSLNAPTIALITNDVVGERMAGPGIRYWEFARVLGQQFPVKLIVPPSVPMENTPSTETLPAPLHVCTRRQEFRQVVETCDVIVTLGANLFLFPFLSQLNKPLVLDMYSPFLLEDLQRQNELDRLARITSHENSLARLRIQLHAGDFFLCADERQRDYWLGALSALGRINPYTYQEDPTLRHLIDVAPFGVRTEPPRHTRPVLKGVYKSIAADDQVILWGGGIWNWLDAPTLIKAMPLILQQRPKVKLFFLGVNRPNKNVPNMNAAKQAIALSKEIGLYESAIFFNDWAPYVDLQNYLLEADVGVSLHLDHAETRFSFRTRLLDYLWAGLPAVCSRGDVLGETLAAYNLAQLVSPGDKEGVAQAILHLLDQPTLRADSAARFRQVAARYHWDVVAEPLVGFCAAPYQAADKPYLPAISPGSAPGGPARRLLAKSWRALSVGGIAGFLQQSKEYLAWKRSKHRKL